MVETKDYSGNDAAKAAIAAAADGQPAETAKAEPAPAGASADRAPAAQESPAPAAKAAPVKKTASAKKPAAKQAPAKKPAKKVAAKKAPARKATAKKTPAPKTPAKAAAKTAAPKTKKTTSSTKTVKQTTKTTSGRAAKKPAATAKETNMTTAEKMTAETTKMAEALTSRMQSFYGDFGTRAKTAFEKGSELFSKTGEFSKANLEAVVESGKIASKGAQDMGKSYAEDVRSNFEELTASMKKVAAVKSPTEFVQVQNELARKSFDTMVSQTSQNSEAMLKLAGEVFQPISNRVSVAMDSIKKAA